MTTNLDTAAIDVLRAVARWTRARWMTHDQAAEVYARATTGQLREVFRWGMDRCATSYNSDAQRAVDLALDALAERGERAFS